MGVLPTALSVTARVRQFGEPFEPGGIDVEFALGGGATGTFLTTLLVGAILVAIAPEYTQRMMARVLDEPVDSLVYGVLSVVALVLVTVLLVITIFGILVAIPLLVVAYVVWAVGASVAFLAIADRLVDHDDGWLVPLLVAAALNGGLTLTGIGGLVAFCIGAAGFGAVLQDWRS